MTTPRTLNVYEWSYPTQNKTTTTTKMNEPILNGMPKRIENALQIKIKVKINTLSTFFRFFLLSIFIIRHWHAFRPLEFQFLSHICIFNSQVANRENYEMLVFQFLSIFNWILKYSYFICSENLFLLFFAFFFCHHERNYTLEILKNCTKIKKNENFSITEYINDFLSSIELIVKKKKFV